ncbi:HNH endonuclease signature motif containing protein [Pengzhenrongella sp.]|jgi:hypothetical protein|uniref:HNH endonuclease signature motif containing protein n=1 Tax=Pengzhenrongella sp. TaxID=2888820 RepID=UPI002F91D007
MYDDEFGWDGDEHVAAFVEPSAELLALWAAEDARYEDPTVVAAEVEQFLEREALFEALARCADEDPRLCEGMDLAPGSAALAQWAGSVDSEELPDFDLVEQIAALERVASWAKAQQLIAVEVLSRRPSMNPDWPITVAEPCVAGEEVAARLGACRQTGRDLLEASRLFAHELIATGYALEAGDLDWGKAKIVIAALKNIPWQVAQQVEEVVLPGAGERTPTQLRKDLQKALIAVDPVDAEDRVVRAVDERRVCHPKVLPDGMAGIWSVLPAAVAAAIDTALTGAARKAKNAGDPRTFDQLRADAYAGTLLGEDAHTCGDAGTSGEAGGRTGSDAPCGAAATGGAGADAAPTSGSAEADASPAVRGAGASRCPAPWIGSIAGQVRIDVTVSLATLLGLDEDPAQLAGYGAITAQTARRLAANGTWRRLVTDPQTGTVLDVGKTTYRPPADLARIIRARDPYCISPICHVNSRYCDLDHREPFNPDGTGGATSADNISPMCRRDHLIKTHAGLTLQRDDNGTITMTTPTGHTYTCVPEPLPGHEHLPQVEKELGLDAETKAAPTAKPDRKPEPDDEPPF